MIVYTHGSSKEVEVSGVTVRIGGWGCTNMKSSEKSRRIPRDLPQINSVGKLLAALDAARAFSQSTKVVLVTDSNYVREGFSSVRKWCANGWILPSGQRVAHREMWQEVLRNLDTMGPRLQVLWCPSHEGILVTNVQITWQRVALRLRSQKFVRKRRPRLLSPSSSLIFFSPGQDPHLPLRAEGSKRRRLLF